MNTERTIAHWQPWNISSVWAITDDRWPLLQGAAQITSSAPSAVHTTGVTFGQGPVLTGQRAVAAMPRTNDTSILTGTYACASCDQRITMAKGEPFPPCPGCGKRTPYHLMTTTH